MARPSKFSAEVKRQAELMARKGWTDVEMSEMLGVTQRTWDNWKKKHARFFQSLKDWKAEADRNVERSLYERACGFKCPEDRIFNNQGEPMVVPTTKHYPPDTAAGIFWLKNRQPDKWRDAQHRIHSVDDDLDSMTPDELKKEIEKLSE